MNVDQALATVQATIQLLSTNCFGWKQHRRRVRAAELGLSILLLQVTTSRTYCCLIEYSCCSKAAVYGKTRQGSSLGRKTSFQGASGSKGGLRTYFLSDLADKILSQTSLTLPRCLSTRYHLCCRIFLFRWSVYSLENYFHLLVGKGTLALDRGWATAPIS